MTDGMTFKENIQNEKRKWGQMNGTQKWDYFKAYYSIPLMIGIGVFVFFVYLILQCFVFHKDVVMSGTIYNMEISQDGILAFEEGYMRYIEGNPKKQEAQIGSSYISRENYNEQMIIQAKVGSETLDFLILDEDAYKLLNEQSFYSNLDDILDETLLKKLSDRVVTTTDIDTGIEYNGGIDISDLGFAKKYIQGKKIYLVFVVSSNHLADANQLVEYLIADE